jgi:hypothetical protein
MPYLRIGQGAGRSECWFWFLRASTTKREIACPFGTLVFTYKNIRRYNPEDLHLSNHRSVNLEIYLRDQIVFSSFLEDSAVILHRFLITVSVRFTIVSTEM